MSFSRPSAPYNGGVETARRILILLAIAGLLAVTANAVSPRGLSWKEPLGHGLLVDVMNAGLTPVDLKDIASLLADPSILFVDARRPEEFAIGHLPRAVNLPPDRVNGTREWNKERPIVVYCANEFCEASLGVAAELKRNGHRRVAVFIPGYEAWWNAGGAVEQE